MSSEAGDGGKEVHLRLSNYMKEIPIQMLSDDNFSEAECQDFRERVKDGLLKRPTVVELEIKAKMLHKDITKHHLERKKQLKNPAEQERLLEEIPTVIAEEIEPEAMPVDALENAAEGNSSSPKSSPLEASDINFTDNAGYGDVGIASGLIQSNSLVQGKEIRCSRNGVTGVEDVNGSEPECEMSRQAEEIDYQHPNLVQKSGVSVIMNCDASIKDVQAVNLEDNGGSPGISEREVKPTQVIELSDDETELEGVKVENPTANENPEDCLWHYLDPQGEVQGPFSMTSLKRWHDAHYFDHGFMVWKIGESRDKAVLLIDALRQSFPCN